jgi:hypothetical protein
LIYMDVYSFETKTKNSVSVTVIIAPAILQFRKENKNIKNKTKHALRKKLISRVHSAQLYRDIYRIHLSNALR